MYYWYVLLGLLFLVMLIVAGLCLTAAFAGLLQVAFSV